MDKTIGISILIGFILDLLLGDPHWLPHPVRMMGSYILWYEKSFRKETDSERAQLGKGIGLVVSLLALTTITAGTVVLFAYRLHQYVGIAVSTVLCYQILSVRGLRNESMKVYRALKEKNLKQARECLSMIVGRDTAGLDEAGITRAAVETVAENTSDGSIAPLIFMLIGGPVLGLIYKAVNTMDSMVGYKNEKYLFFGRAAAKADDVFNYLPSRFAGLFMVMAAGMLRLNMHGAWRIFRRDSRNHASPNSAMTEAACAGALGLMLAGDASYFGKIVKKPTIGDACRQIEAEDIRRANRLLYATSILMLLAGEGIRYGIQYGIF